MILHHRHLYRRNGNGSETFRRRDDELSTRRIQHFPLKGVSNLHTIGDAYCSPDPISPSTTRPPLRSNITFHSSLLRTHYSTTVSHHFLGADDSIFRIGSCEFRIKNHSVEISTHRYRPGWPRSKRSSIIRPGPTSRHWSDDGSTTKH